MSEFQRFTPDIPVVLYHGPPAERRAKLPLIQQKQKRRLPVVVTSYEIAMRDRLQLHAQCDPPPHAPLRSCALTARATASAWKFIFVDEGHRLKNLNCRLIRELKMYEGTNRLLLTGTPLQNNLTELWSLLNFLMPKIFDDLDQFQQWFDFEGIATVEGDRRIIEEEQQDKIVSKLHGILRPFLLRRLKTDVELAIPPKKEVVLSVLLLPRRGRPRLTSAPSVATRR